MNKDIVFKVENVYKSFRIPHEKHASLKSAILNIFKRKTYTVHCAVREISFEIKKGEFFGIIGRNGCGKSTILKMLAGIYLPDKGKINVSGEISPFLELGVGFNPDLTARENVFLGGAILGIPRKEIEKNFDNIIGFAELEEFVDMKFKNFSSGMQVRLAFSLAISAHAEILLMDEVLAVGDSNFQGKCLEEFKKYKQQGKTVVLVSHDISTIQKYCDRAMLLRDGEIVKIGKAEDVGNEYINQNISDEEKRISHENKTSEGHIPGGSVDKDPRRIAEITRVDFFDQDNKMKDIFKTGETIFIKVSFKKNKEAGKINIGIGLYEDSGIYIFGYNTQMDKYEIRNDAEFIVLKLNTSPLLKGSYFINVICFGDVEQKYYDFKMKVRKLKVCTSGKENNYRGLLVIKHEWNN